MRAKENFMQSLIKPLLKKGSLKLVKPIHHLIHLLWGVRNHCFISVAPMVCMSCVFVYDAVDVNKIVAISSTKPPSYAYVQVTAGLKLFLG